MDQGAASGITDRLIEARRQGDAAGAVALECAPATVDDAYQVQEITAQRLGGLVAGYKIGLTAPGPRQAMGATAPIAGFLPADAILSSPASARVTARHMRVAEAELVVELARDLLPGDGPVTVADVAGAVAALYAGIEICDCRFISDDVPLPALIADNGFADRLVIGDRLDLPVDQLDTIPVRLDRSQGSSVEGSTARIDGGPLAAIAWLANHLAARGQFLRAGQKVATGSCTGITTLEADETVIVVFPGPATASFTFQQVSAEEER